MNKSKEKNNYWRRWQRSYLKSTEMGQSERHSCTSDQIGGPGGDMGRRPGTISNERKNLEEQLESVGALKMEHIRD